MERVAPSEKVRGSRFPLRMQRTAQRNDNSRIPRLDRWWSTLRQGLGLNAHQLPQPLGFPQFDADPSLSCSSSLVILDCHGSSADHKQSPIRAAQPVVESRRLNSQANGRIPNDQQIVGARIEFIWSGTGRTLCGATGSCPSRPEFWRWRGCFRHVQYSGNGFAHHLRTVRRK